MHKFRQVEAVNCVSAVL